MSGSNSRTLNEDNFEINPTSDEIGSLSLDEIVEPDVILNTNKGTKTQYNSESDYDDNDSSDILNEELMGPKHKKTLLIIPRTFDVESDENHQPHCPQSKIRKPKDISKQDKDGNEDRHDSFTARTSFITPSTSSEEEEEEEDHLRYHVKRIMTKPIVGDLFLTLILINSIMMGFGTFDFISDDEIANATFFYCDLGFLIIFTFESILTIFHLRRETLSDSWVVFDTFIIVLSWITSAFGRFDPTLEGASVQVVRALRMFRILNKVEALKVVLIAISRSLARLYCLAIFLFIISFIFAVYFTEQFGGMYEKGQTDVDYFSRLDWTFLTLYQLMTFDNWMFVTRQIADVYSLAYIPIILYVTLTGFVITNLLIAIICDSIFEINSDMKEDKVKLMAKDMKELEYQMCIMCHEICDNLNLPVPPSINPQGLVNSQHSTRFDESIEDDQGRRCDCTFGSLSEFRISCGKIINNDYVQGVLVFLVIFNALILALGTFSFAKEEPAYTVFETMNSILLIVFTVEIGMQFIFHGMKMFKDGWHTFDFLLILLSWALSLSPAFRVFRVLRLMHILPKFEAMRVITGTLYAAIPRVSAVAAILLLFFYITAVIFTILFQDVPVGGENGLSYGYFARLDKSLLSLFQIMTMEDWAKISRQLGAHVPWAPMPISAFLTISGLLFIKTIVALICQVNEVMEEAKKEKEKLLKHGPEKSYEERVLAIDVMRDDLLKLLETYCANETSSRSNG